ncbi:hypothetical protein EUX98_g2916 [Antrodiella citrinella]|uniref:Cytochrome P450 n=1 Tax=Antrodiella citrinella TaxID=2447956 RepID=A0A4S4N009_9APHY|nr:hypothetical protein EUX98_g2916 [Antrodiella citrinella]
MSVAAVGVTVLVAAVVSHLIFTTLLSRKQGLSVPPGPPRRWLVGNLFDVPLVTPWFTYKAWCDKFGDMVYLDLPGKSVLILGSIQAANALLDCKSHIYSDRPKSVMVNLLSWEWTFSFMRYGSVWRSYRRSFHSHYNGASVRSYRTIQLQESRMLLKRIINTPREARKHVRRYTGSIIIRVTYGAPTVSQTNRYIALAESAVQSAREIAVPAAFMVESLPFLKYIPAWMPGGHTSRYVAKYKPIVQEMRNKPFDDVKAAAAAGRATSSVAYSLITEAQDENLDLTPEQDAMMRNVTALAYAAAPDTTTSVIDSCMLAMAMFPETQKKVHAELDLHVGPTRLPDFGDLEHLTYLKAVILEVLRWMVATPIGLPHALSEDDEHNRYHIPKGTVVVTNIWSVKLMNFFGFGEVEAGVDDLGSPVELTTDCGNDAICSPATFPRSFKPRTQELESLARDQTMADEE